jgi:alginate O-acetyltransferase complex protein AlgI
MIFNTWTFGIFGLTTLLVYWGLIPKRWRPSYLIVAGAIFYAWSVPQYLLLIGALGGTTFGIGRAMLRDRSARRRRILIVVGVTLITGVLVGFKYLGLLAGTADSLAARSIVPIPHLAVPLAISFFTFEFVHVLVDIYGGKIIRLDGLEFAVFTLFFPTLVAGPIKRYEGFAPMVRCIEVPGLVETGLNLYRIAIGLAKKFIIADSMTPLVLPITDPTGAPYGQIDAVVAMLAYTAKIYFDFTGYSDIAIGLANLLGFPIPENFDRPYRSANIAVFWRRWHMSLSTWIRDYVFIPMGGSRGRPLATATNLFAAMALAGLWHGAAWTFVVWGLWHGAGLAVHRLWTTRVVPAVAVLRTPSRPLTYSSIAITFTFVVFGWILFAAPTFGAASLTFERAFGLAH